jgi:nitrate/nitrite transporter NarK
MSGPHPANSRQLGLATLSFAVSFAAWGLVSAFAPTFREIFALSATQTALLVAVPVLLGALARLPVGMLADRFGGRLVYTALGGRDHGGDPPRRDQGPALHLLQPPGLPA